MPCVVCLFYPCVVQTVLFVPLALPYLLCPKSVTFDIEFECFRYVLGLFCLTCPGRTGCLRQLCHGGVLGVQSLAGVCVAWDGSPMEGVVRTSTIE